MKRTILLPDPLFVADSAKERATTLHRHTIKLTVDIINEGQQFMTYLPSHVAKVVLP